MGKPSISMGHGFHGELLNNQRVTTRSEDLPILQVNRWSLGRLSTMDNIEYPKNPMVCHHFRYENCNLGGILIPHVQTHAYAWNAVETSFGPHFVAKNAKRLSFKYLLDLVCFMLLSYLHLFLSQIREKSLISDHYAVLHQPANAQTCWPQGNQLREGH